MTSSIWVDIVQKHTDLFFSPSSLQEKILLFICEIQVSLKSEGSEGIAVTPQGLTAGSRQGHYGVMTQPPGLHSESQAVWVA